MNKKTSKVLETPTGVGEIRDAGEYIARASYRLEIRQEIFISESLNSREEIPGQLEISGEVTVNESERMQPRVMQIMNSGSLFTLHLSDGRALDMSALKGDPISGRYSVKPGPGVSFGFVKS